MSLTMPKGPEHVGKTETTKQEITTLVAIQISERGVRFGGLHFVVFFTYLGCYGSKAFIYMYRV